MVDNGLSVYERLQLLGSEWVIMRSEVVTFVHEQTIEYSLQCQPRHTVGVESVDDSVPPILRWASFATQEGMETEG